MAGDRTVRVTIAVPHHPYEAVIGNNLLGRASSHLRNVLGDRERLFVLTVPMVRRRWGGKLLTL